MTACSFIFQSSHRHHRRHHRTNRFQTERWWALSDDFLESDLVAVRKSPDGTPRLCAVKPDGTVAPLCQRHDDVETDLFCDPREFSERFWENLTDEAVSGRYGEGFYGQRPVPSLGGGPGYGADADEIWSVSDESVPMVLSCPSWMLVSHTAKRLEVDPPNKSASCMLGFVVYDPTGMHCPLPPNRV
jgi:hypothetical protein